MMATIIPDMLVAIIIYLLVRFFVMGLAIKKYPPMPSLFAGVVAGGATAMIVQGQSGQSIFDFANNGYSISTGIEEIDSLLNRGGYNR